MEQLTCKMLPSQAYLQHAVRVASTSPDPSTQNAALLLQYGQIVAIDTNHFPAGVQVRDERWKRPGKYMWVEHAERNVIYKAAREGIYTNGLTMVCPWAACADCARAIIQAGIHILIRLKHDNTNTRWDESCQVGDIMLQEAGIEIQEFDSIFPNPEDYKILRNEKLVQVQ